MSMILPNTPLAKKPHLHEIQDKEEGITELINVFEDMLPSVSIVRCGNMIVVGNKYQFRFHSTLVQPIIRKSDMKDFGYTYNLYFRGEDDTELKSGEAWAHEIIKEALENTFNQAA